MGAGIKIRPASHVVDILGSTKGRDQPILLIEKAVDLVRCLNSDILIDPNTVFLDPFCKAGEILLATALVSFIARIQRAKPIATYEEIVSELYAGRYFALSPDERHHLLSKRTFCGNDRSHDSKFTKYIRNGNYVSDVDGRLNEERFKEELRAMIEFIKKTNSKAKIVVVGNPPYQEADGGAKASAKPVYNFFVEQLIDSGEIDELSVVIPARWFSGGKNLESFRKKIAQSNQVKTLHYFERAEDVFPTVHVQGGICFLNWKKKYSGNAAFVYKATTYDIDLSKFDIIPDDPQSAPIIKKIMESSVKESIADYAWSGKPFGLRTFYFQRNAEAAEGRSDTVRCYTKGKKIRNILRSTVTVNADKIDKWKVAIPRAYATGARRCTLPKHQIFLLKKGEIATETYNVVGCFDTKLEAESLISYLQTDFARYLLGLRKLTQDIPKDRWAWVPYMDIKMDWTDEKLFNFFKLTKKEQEHIKKKVQEWS